MAALMCCTGCSALSPADRDARSRWLQSTLVVDNQDLLRRVPGLVAGKFARMSQTSYKFFRGSLGQFLRDATEPSVGYLPTAFADPAVMDVLLVGDPHPENFGTYRPTAGERVPLELNDFDGARYGPFHLDLRRLAAAFALLAKENQLSEEEVARAMGSGYVEESAAWERGEPPVAPDFLRGDGAVVDDLFGSALNDGLAREELLTLTHIDDDGERRLAMLPVSTDVTPFDGGVPREESLDDVAPELRAAVLGMVERYADRLTATHAASYFGVKDLKQRFGSGVASYPILRLLVLVEGPSPSNDDDVILELKEARDALPIEGLQITPPRPWTSNAERIVAAQRALQADVAREVSPRDPLLGATGDEVQSFRVRELNAYQNGFNTLRFKRKFEEGDFVGEDLVVYATLCGRILARSHHFARTARGERAGDAIRSVIGGREEELVEETTAFALHYAGVAHADYERFISLLIEEGPTLGYPTDA